MIFVQINNGNNYIYSELKGDTYHLNHIVIGKTNIISEDSSKYTYSQHFEFVLETNENDSHLFSFDVLSFEFKKNSSKLFSYGKTIMFTLHSFIILAKENSIMFTDLEQNTSDLQNFLSKKYYSINELINKHLEINKKIVEINNDFI